MASDVYPYRPNFKAAVKQLRSSRGISLSDVAELLGLTLGSLHDYLYKPLHRPGRDPLKRLAGLTNRPMSDFDDDPGAPPEGTTNESSEIDRFMPRVMGSDIAKHQLVWNTGKIRYPSEDFGTPKAIFTF